MIVVEVAWPFLDSKTASHASDTDGEVFLFPDGINMAVGLWFFAIAKQWLQTDASKTCRGRE